jgi:hypothetical protein
MRTYNTFVLIKHLVVLGQIGAEQDRLNVVEAVEPFSPLRSVFTGVEDLICEFADL